MAKKNSSSQFLLCIHNETYPASLELRKVYQAIPDADAASKHFVRIVDESGEDYLYPQAWFVPIDLPQAAQRVFARAS